jgi:hypothetical protein
MPCFAAAASAIISYLYEVTRNSWSEWLPISSVKAVGVTDAALALEMVDVLVL